MQITWKSASLVSFFFLVLWNFTSCHSGMNSRDDGREGLATSIDTIEDGKLSTDYPIPSLAELTSRLQKAGVGYAIGSGSDPKNATRYVTSTSRAVNLGVYGSDLLYASTYGQKADVSKYLAAVLILAQELNIHISLLEVLNTQGEAGLNDKDSVQSKTTKSIFEAYALLCNANMQEEAILFLAGGWLESVYIGSYIASLSQTNDEVVDLLLQQQGAFDTIRKLLGTHKRSEDGEFVLSLFNEIAPTYEDLKAMPQNEMKTRNLADVLESARGRLLNMGLE